MRLPKSVEVGVPEIIGEPDGDVAEVSAEAAASVVEEELFIAEASGLRSLRVSCNSWRSSRISARDWAFSARICSIMARSSRTCESSSRPGASAAGDAGAGPLSCAWLPMLNRTKAPVVIAVERSAKVHGLFTQIGRAHV